MQKHKQKTQMRKSINRLVKVDCVNPFPNNKQINSDDKQTNKKTKRTKEDPPVEIDGVDLFPNGLDTLAESLADCWFGQQTVNATNLL